EAQKVYERVIRDFSDQTELASLARTRLGVESRASAATGMVLRRVWAGIDVDGEGMVSADGRYVSFPAWATGDQAVRDLTSGTSYLLTRHDGESAYPEYA